MWRYGLWGTWGQRWLLGRPPTPRQSRWSLKRRWWWRRGCRMSWGSTWGRALIAVSSIDLRCPWLPFSFFATCHFTDLEHLSWRTEIYSTSKDLQDIFPRCQHYSTGWGRDWDSHQPRQKQGGFNCIVFNCVSKIFPLPRSYVGLPAAPAATPCLTILFHEGISSLYRCLWRLTSFISLQLKQLTLVFSLGLGLGVGNGLGSLLKILHLRCPSPENHQNTY